MGSTTGIAQTGLQVAAIALDVSANNVANVLTEDFEPSRVAPEELAEGGVTARVEKLQQPQDPMAEVRADRALLVTDHVDLAQEMVNQSVAAAMYRANLASLQTAQQMEKDLADALKDR
jgi:flagellar hook protein FlgE